jgi:hypothetical protein
MRDTLKALTELGISAKEESESLRILSEQAQKDARFTKILTFVAMLYLPASLIAVSLFAASLSYINISMITENSIDYFQFKSTADCEHRKPHRKHKICSGSPILGIPGSDSYSDSSHHGPCCHYREATKKEIY